MRASIQLAMRRRNCSELQLSYGSDSFSAAPFFAVTFGAFEIYLAKAEIVVLGERLDPAFAFAPAFGVAPAVAGRGLIRRKLVAMPIAQHAIESFRL